MSIRENSWLLAILVIAVVGATLYLSIKNNSMDVVDALATAVFGYYFGLKGGSGGDDNVAQ
jgi:hypothetical protein